MNSNMITNKDVCKIQQSIFYLLSSLDFLSLEYIDTVLVIFVEIVLGIFVGIVFVTFVNTLPVAFTISLHTIPDLSGVLFKYLPFSQIHELGSQL